VIAIRYLFVGLFRPLAAKLSDGRPYGGLPVGGRRLVRRPGPLAAAAHLGQVGDVYAPTDISASTDIITVVITVC
jgi:hypothetical protein